MNLAKMKSFSHLHAASERDRKILETLPTARKLAKRLWFRTHRQYPFEDLFMEAATAATEGVDRYIEIEGAAFTTYIHMRIWGAIVNYVRRVSHCRSKGFAGDEQFAIVSSDGGGTPASAEELLISTYIDPETCALLGECVDPHHTNYQTALALRLYYLEGRPMREIGAQLGVTFSRVSQILMRAPARLNANAAVSNQTKGASPD